ncbi:MAG: hypothetical protein AB8H86_18780 [Polyangiales bacterium]
MNEIASGSGTAIVTDGERLLVVHRGGPGLSVALFVVGLLTFIAAFNGAAQMVMAFSGSGVGFTGAAILCAIGGVCGAVLVALLRKRKHRAGVPLDQLPIICVVDFTQGGLLDAHGALLAPLPEVRMRRQFQMASSSPALVLAYAGRSLLLAKGSPFAGGIGNLERALEAHGVLRTA